MQRADMALRILQVHAAYAQRGVSLATAALAGANAFVCWQHYPKNDAVDDEHQTRFFYHAHDHDEALPNEHGHFHVFAKSSGQRAQTYAHLVGISLNAMGEPTRLFTTNQWVTGESMQAAHVLAQVIDGFVVQCHGRLAPIATWLTAVLGFYKDVIVKLLYQRDALLAQRGFDAAVLNDREIHIVSEQPLTHYWDHLKKEIV